MSYKAVFENDYSEERKGLHALRRQLQDQYEEKFRAEQKRRQPRRRVNFDPLPEDVVERLRTEALTSPLGREFQRLEDEIKAGTERREKLLEAMADKVEFEPDTASHRLQVAHSSTWNTQGYGAQRYAKGELSPLADYLGSLGFETHIREVNYRPARGAFGVAYSDYELWANCPPWMFDAAKRRLSLRDWADSLKRRAINPLVYNPFLPDYCRL